MAYQCISQYFRKSLSFILGEIDNAIAATRGAAIAITMIEKEKITFAGVGNIRGLRWRAGCEKRFSSQYGVVGGGINSSRILTETCDWQPGDCVLLYTDGIQEMIHMPVLLPEWRTHPLMMCDAILQKWKHHVPDDAGILVYFHPEGYPSNSLK